ncbi:Trafficking protein particle complex subunit BET5 [Collariella sp. IMI 366227]|nr:Trafficking protein particle complex subunit BET5 [Collariella sp. IMI 366227]
MVVYSFYIFDRHMHLLQSPLDHGPNLQPHTALLPSSKTSSSDDNAKLIFGTVFSLRNMVRKLGGEDDAFVSFRTANYKLHYYETASSLRLVMLTDIATLSMRNVLHQIYINLWVEYGT